MRFAVKTQSGPATYENVQRACCGPAPAPKVARKQSPGSTRHSYVASWRVVLVPFSTYDQIERRLLENVMLRGLGRLITGSMMFYITPASAQYAPVDTTPMGQTATGVMANKISGDIASRNVRSNSVSSRCLADSGPGAERRAMEAQYDKLLRSNGRQRADAWRAEHGRRYRAKLKAEGKCR